MRSREGITKVWRMTGGSNREQGGNKEGKELDGPFLQSIDTSFASLAHSNLHTQYAAAFW